MSLKDKKLDDSDILDLEEYIQNRKSIRKEIVNMKKNRRISLGPYCTFYFENFYTMQAQIQEMLYIEKGGDEQLKDELEAYNPLIPQGKELVATMMLEIDNPETRKKILSQLGSVENQIFISVNGEKIYATPEDDIERTDKYGKTSSVHFVHFYMNKEQISSFKELSNKIEIGTDHNHYSHLTKIPKEVHETLINDFD
jgi:hypothetical protein